MKRLLYFGIIIATCFFLYSLCQKPLVYWDLLELNGEEETVKGTFASQDQCTNALGSQALEDNHYCGRNCIFDGSYTSYLCQDYCAFGKCFKNGAPVDNRTVFDNTGPAFIALCLVAMIGFYALIKLLSAWIVSLFTHKRIEDTPRPEAQTSWKTIGLYILVWAAVGFGALLFSRGYEPSPIIQGVLAVGIIVIVGALTDKLAFG